MSHIYLQNKNKNKATVTTASNIRQTNQSSSRWFILFI
ncbi:hypothetical protein ykris0001_17660 [Yersinia kristensenii ATCC 33638]|nr:hypothetical protein ykris0001_17660 [Yersinia kristensenii ATCC 33638]